MGGGGIAPPFLTSALDGGAWFTPLAFYPLGKGLDAHSIEGWVGPRAGLDAME
jgi:hypothetical protein